MTRLSLSLFYLMVVFCYSSLFLWTTLLFSLLSLFSTAPLRSPSEVARAHNKESYDFMAGGRQHQAFHWSALQPTNGSVDPDPPSVHAQLLHHTISSFYHVVPVVRARVYTLTYLPRCHGFGVISGRRTGIELV